jgi:hypothetical protein
MASAAEIMRQLQDTENYQTCFDQSRTRIDFECIIILSSLYVCMAIKYIIVLFVETPRKFITFAVINLRGVSTNKTII